MLRFFAMIIFILPKITVWPLVYFMRRRKRTRDALSQPAAVLCETKTPEEKEGEII